MRKKNANVAPPIPPEDIAAKDDREYELPVETVVTPPVTPVAPAPPAVDLTQSGTAAIQSAVKNNKDYTAFLSPEQKQAIADSVFGPKPEPEDEYARALNAERQTFQDMLNRRRGELEKERTNNIRMATFHSLGNALRTMAQPIGWAAGGATAGVQPYDSRQYLDAYNRAVRAGEEIQNLGNTEARFELDLARRATEDAKAERDWQRKQDESIKQYGQRMAEQLLADGQKEIEKRRTIAIKGYYDLMKSDSIHKGGYPSFDEFIRLGGYGSELFGGLKLSDEEVAAIAEAKGLTSTGKPERSAGAKSSKSSGSGSGRGHADLGNGRETATL